MSSDTNDTSRISISAHYTGYVWYKYNLSAPAFVTGMGRFANLLLSPINGLLRTFANADIDIFLLQRHAVIDHQVKDLIENHGVSQILELASGLSPRGYRLTKQYPHLNYIEGDLPGMAQRKQAVLKQAGCSDKHNVYPCNILTEDGEHSISALLAKFDASKPTLIITEGLINYFELPVIRAVWSRMANGLARFPTGHYVTDLYPDFAEHPSYKYVKIAQSLVGTLTRGQWPLHYNSDNAIQTGFSEDGFKQVKVIDPASLYGQVEGLPEADIQTLVRIIQASV
ncbi:MAG: class I SAM-dependent methyltransferase [Oleibacter sp.]|nr:class I SAM-dependent methyltransferase [Thalassolituus sp.]